MFFLLGIVFDTGFRMRKAIAVFAREAGWRLTFCARIVALLWPRCLVCRNFKCCRTSSLVRVYYRALFLLRRIDSIQERRLRQICVTPEESLEKFRLASFASRRYIGMLYLLHKIVLCGHLHSLLLFFFLQKPNQKPFTQLLAPKQKDQQRSINPSR